MGKVCLLKAGKFLLGLNTSHIVSTVSVEDFKAGKTNKTDPNFLFLESFLAQKPLDIEGSEVIVLKKNPNKLTLLIDRTLGEIKLPDRFEPYPLLYPDLAMKCCPKIFIHEDQVVLLIDSKQLNKIHKDLKTKHGLITLKDLKSIKKKIEQVEILPPENSKIDDEQQEKAKPRPDLKIETKINDKTISKIVAFTFDKCNQSDNYEKVIIPADKLPPGLIEQEGLSKESLQELIDKTILQCEKTRYQSMKNMIKDKLSKIKF